ncbi:MAG TPA: glycosyl transferase family A [Cyanobacteria bacterium UBA8543]|nr:glycosyl transferase family A [Cyanobacteria bacterium UBA8543]
MPLISVIIPVYNGEKTIKETIESVLNQTFTNFEIIVINDGSKDATIQIVESIQDPRIKLFSYPNAGQAASRNRGISKAVGEFIAFLDADDLWTPDKLEAQLKALQENPQAAVAYSWTDFIDESGKFLRPGAYMSVTGDVYKHLLVVNFLENGSNPLIRASALREVGNFDESLSNAHDWDMWLRLAARYHFVAVSSIQILYRVSSTSMSSNVLGMQKSSLRVIERAYAQAPESIQHFKRISLANSHKYLIFKALEGFPNPKKGLAAAWFLWYAVRNDPVLLRRRIFWKVLFNIALVVSLPPQMAKNLLSKMHKIGNLNTLFTSIQTHP